MSEFSKIIGYEGVKQEMIRYCDAIKNPKKYEALGVQIPHGILLHGEPGIGKTLVSECFMKESGCKSYVIRKNMPTSDFIRHISDTFLEASQNTPSIVLLDDLDKYANEGFQFRDAEEYVAVQAAIDEYAPQGVFVLATANVVEFLPDSLLRDGRFDRIIELEYPHGKDSEKILEHYLASKPVADDIDVKEIVFLMSGKNCAALEKVINDAGIHAAFDGKDKIDQQTLLESCIKYLTDSLDLTETECNKERRRIVCIHEAGHTVVQEFWHNGSVKLTSLRGANSKRGGITIYDREYGINTQDDVFQCISASLAGKAAVEVILGGKDIGCSSDVEHARDHAERYISDICADSFGSFVPRRNASNYGLDNRDRNINELLTEVYKVTLEIVEENADLIKEVAKNLSIKETLTYKDLASIKATIGWNKKKSRIKHTNLALAE